MTRSAMDTDAIRATADSIYPSEVGAEAAGTIRALCDALDVAREEITRLRAATAGLRDALDAAEQRIRTVAAGEASP